MAKEWAKTFYNSVLWKQVREAVLKRDRYMCQSYGCHNIAEEVHHKIELTPENINDPSITVNMDNLISLCSTCHKAITKAEHKKQKASSILPEIIFDGNGYPVIAPPRGC